LPRRAAVSGLSTAPDRSKGSTDTMTVKKRYQLYYPLLASCFAFQIVNAAVSLTRWAGWHSFHSVGAWYKLSATAYILSWLILVFCICARFLRDEYAEVLWKRAAEHFVYWLVLTPPLCMIVLGFVGEGIFDGLAHTRALTPTNEKGDIWLAGANRAQIEFAAMATMIYLTTMLTPVLFGGLLLWQRWRDR
jgi:hypothetical protein